MTRILLAAFFAALAALPVRAAVEIQEVVSEGGITAWLVEEHSIPFVALEARFKGGASLDPADKRGAGFLMTGLIEEGAGDLDSRAFAKELERLAAGFEFDIFDDSMAVSARFLTENRDEAVDLLRLALTEPRFDPDAIERVREQVLSIIRSDREDPNKIAARTFDRLAFPGSPYATPLEGTEETVGALTRDDIVAAHARTMTRDRLYVGVVGDITPEELGPLLDRLFGALPADGPPLPPKATYSLDGGVTYVEYDTPQSVIVFGHEGITRDDPDFFPAYIANQIFGAGGFGSRLTEEVRVKRGLTYGISTFLLPMELGQLYLGQAATANARVAETIEVVRDEWRKMAEEGVTAEELERAKTYLTGAYPLRFDGNGPIARIMVGMQVQGLPIDYIATRNDKVRAVTLEDVRRVARRIYRPDDLHFVVVGGPDVVLPTN